MINKDKILNIQFEKKFTTVDFEFFLNKYFNNCLDYENIVFQLDNIEWFALEELTFLFGWIRYLKNNHPNLKSLKINLPKLLPKEDTDDYRRRKQRLLSLWNVWKIWQKCELDLLKETNIDSSINEYVDKYQYDSHWHNIIPFTKLDSKSINDFTDLREKVERNVYDRFDLSENVERILEKYTSLTPFENKALSGIITTELFLNSIIHAYYPTDNFTECYFAVSLRNKIDVSEYRENKEIHGEFLSEDEINRRINFILKENLNEKSRDEQPYFQDLNNKDNSINDSFIEFSFLDFGIGIPKKLREIYNNSDLNSLPLSKKHFIRNDKNEYLISEDSRIIEYSFLLDTSSNSFDKRLEINDYVPRGLFFLVDIIRRYRGLLVVRSGKGKVIYNFRNTNVISEAVEFSLSDSSLENFNGTLISIYLPSMKERELIFNKIQINLENKIKENNEKDKSQVIEYININEIIKLNKAQLNGGSLTELYNNTFKKLNEKIDSFKFKYCTVYIDFSGTENAEIINRKLYFYLCNTPRLNSNTRVIIVHPSNLGELYQAKQAIKYSKLPIFRPIPCFIYDNKKKIQIIWLGITEEQDENLLNNCILSQDRKIYNIDKYVNKDELAGNVITIDESDFVSVNIDNVSNILEHYSSKFIFEEIPERFIKKYLSNDKSVSKQPRIIQDNKSYIYWTSGGYYQEKFITLIDLLYSYDAIKIGNRGETIDEHFGERVARYLIEKYNYYNNEPLEIDYIVTVTLSSQLLGKHIKDMYHRLILNEGSGHKKPELIRLANYHEYTLEKAFIRIKENKKVLIVNDVISTGRLCKELYHKLSTSKKSDVVAIFTLIDSRDINSKEVEHYYDEVVDQKTYKLVSYPIEKFKSKKNLIGNFKKEVISIDPVINTPSMMKLERSMGDNILYFENKGNGEKGNEAFLQNFTNYEHLWIGHFNHNVAHHSYYFKTHEILLSDKGEKLLKEIFEFITKLEFNDDEINYVFHPMFSAIETLTNNKLKDILLSFPNFNIFPLPRIDTPKGWRFTFPPKLLNATGWNFTKRNVLIIDDGSCSGDTLLQMIDSIAMIEVNKIVVVSIIARLEDFQREFFSRISSIKGYKKYESHVVSKNESWNSISAKFGISVSELQKYNKDILNEGDIIGIPQLAETNKIIPLSIYFGTHFHIPVYSPLKHCPFCEEMDLLGKELNSTIEPPESAKNYIKRRMNSILQYETDGSPTDKNVSEEYNGLPNYFPMEIDSKKVFIARDAIGKIDTYRLYRDYIKDSYDNIEIDYYLAVIIHEKRLIDSINHLLPHLKARLVNAVKNKFNLKSNDTGINLSLNWQNVEIIRALHLLKEDIFFDDNTIKGIITKLNNDDFDSIEFLIYVFWKRLKNCGDSNNLMLQIDWIYANLNGRIKRTWGLFREWILNQQKHPYLNEFSFQYLKDFYIRKDIEYPNHLTIGSDFLTFSTRIKGLRYKIERSNLSDVSDADYSDLIDLLNIAISKINTPFVDIISNEKFIEIIQLCGMYDKFYDENVCITSLIKNIKQNFFVQATIDEINSVIDKVDVLIDSYLNSSSDFAKFFQRHDTKILKEFEGVKNEFTAKLINEKIEYDEKIDISLEEICNIHPDCFSLIVRELFNNCIKHSSKSSRKNSVTIDIEKINNDIVIDYKHAQEQKIKQEKNIELNGLKKVETVVRYFGGIFKYASSKDEFVVNLTIPISKRDYTFISK